MDQIDNIDKVFEIADGPYNVGERRESGFHFVYPLFRARVSSSPE